MDRDGRYTHIEDVLAELHQGQWFTFTDGNNKTYDDLIILDNSKAKPTEKELTDALAKQQSDFDANQYQRDRATDYPTWQEQMDLIYHKGVAGLKAELKKTKDKFPKE